MSTFLPLYLLLLAGSLGVSLLVTGRSIHWAQKLGMLDAPGHRKIHSTTIPRNGGLGIYAGFMFVFLGAVLTVLFLPVQWLPTTLATFVSHHGNGIRQEWLALTGLVVGSSLVFLGGLLDDRYTLSPKVKLLWEFAGVAVLVGCGYRFDFHRLFWNHPLGEYLIAVPLTCFWMIFLINAFNLLDNMDGLSSGVATITTAFFAVYAHLQGEFFLTAAMCCLMGGLMGFLHYNWSPARIFMGDGGALFIGCLIAAFTCRCTYYQHPPESLFSWFTGRGVDVREQGVLTLLTPLVIMAVPIFDTVSVIFIRLKNRKPIMVGDTNHFSHRLVALGLERKHAVEVIYLVTVFTGLGALILRSAGVLQAVLVFLQVVSVFGVITLLENRGSNSAQRVLEGPAEAKD